MGLTISTKPKQPREIQRKGYDFDGDDRLEAGDALLLLGSVFQVFELPARIDVSTAMIVPASEAVVGKEISCLIQAGENGKEYLLSILAATVNGEFLEEDYQFAVEEL